MSAAGGFPRSVLLEPFIFHRFDDETFPDESKAPIRVTTTTTWGATLRIAFSFGEPGNICRLYAQLPLPPYIDRKRYLPLRFVATHRHLALINVASQLPQIPQFVQEFFILDAHRPSSSLTLTALPPCTEPDFDYTSVKQPRRGRVVPPHAAPHMLYFLHMGLWRGAKEFVVAELTLSKPIKLNKVFADIYLLRSSSMEWESMRVQFLSTKNPANADLQQICWWCTDAVVPFSKWLCWIDYHRGILFCDMSKLPGDPTVSFIWFPLDKLPHSSDRYCTSTNAFRAVSVVDHGRALKFINVTRHDGIPFAPLQPGTGFTITCHTLIVLDGSMAWKEDYTVTSRELWEANTPERLPRHPLMFPQVDMYRPRVAHFLSIEFGPANKNKKMWVVSIDMSTKTVESSSLYINGDEGLQTDDPEFIRRKSMSPRPFIPCEFLKFVNFPRKGDNKD